MDLQQLKQKFQSFFNKPTAPSDPNTPPKAPLPWRKILIITVSLIILSLLTYINWRLYEHKKLYTQASQEIARQIAQKKEVTQILGQSITPAKRGYGNISQAPYTGQLILDLKGSSGQGHAEVSLQQGQIEQLKITFDSGQTIDVLAQEKQEQQKILQEQQKRAQIQAIEQAYNEALLALENQAYDAAIAGFNQSIANHYQEANSYEYLGIIYSQQGQFEACVDNFNKAIAAQPEKAQLYYQISYCYLQRFDINNALQNLQKSCALGFQDACTAAQNISKEQAEQAQTQEKVLTPTETNPALKQDLDTPVSNMGRKPQD